MLWRRSGVVLPQRLRAWPAGCAIGTLAVAALVAVLDPLRLDLGLTNIALLLLLLTVVVAAAWGWIAGLYISVLSNLAFNYFFVPPLYRFTVERLQNVLALALFLLVAAITASLLARTRRSAREAERRAHDTQTLLDLGRTTRDVPLEQLPAAICAWIVRDFQVRSCGIYRVAGEELETVAWAGEDELALNRGQRSVAFQALRSGRPAGLGYRLPRAGRRRVDPQDQGLLFLPLRLESSSIGVLRVRTAGAPLRVDQERLLEAFAGEAAGTLQRISLAASAQAAAVLQETDRLRSSLLSSVSHDLRTPLTSIKASVANLMSDEVSWSDEARQEFLTAIDGEADRLTRLVTNLLDLSRIEAGALRLDLDWNDLEELVRNAIYRVERQIPERAIRLHLSGPLPLLRFDYVQIDRVIANLLDNAIKYSTPGTPIETRVNADDQTVTVAVANEGAGIAPAERARIFDAFYRSERRRDPAAGSGLGLAICRGIIEAHHGRIWAEPQSPLPLGEGTGEGKGEGDGALLCFTLPRSAAPATPEGPAGVPAAGAGLR